MDPTQQPPDPKLQNVFNPLASMRDGEQVLCEINRHPIGIISVYLSTAIVIILAVTVAVVGPQHITDTTNRTKEAFAFGALIVSAIALLYAYVARVVYKGNRWILTDDSLTQVTQEGLFRKHSSQLSLANLEDVTADQNGMVQAMFGYGNLRAETAGERSKFVFAYCPKPNEFAKQILAAREAFIMNDPAAASRANDKLGVPRDPQQTYTQPQPQYQQAPPQATQPYYPPPDPSSNNPVQQPPYTQPTPQNDQPTEYPSQGNDQQPSQ